MRYLILCYVFIVSAIVSAQEFCGTTGLIAVPTAETAEAGTFRGGAFFLDKDLYGKGYYYLGSHTAGDIFHMDRRSRYQSFHSE